MTRIDFSQVVTAEAREATALDAARAAGHARVIALIDAATAGITGPVPLAEMLSWTSKEEAARSLLAGGGSPSDPATLAILGGEAAVTGETIEDLAARIILNADAYRTAIAHLSGLRRVAAAAITAAATTAEVEAAITGLAAQLGALSRA